MRAISTALNLIAQTIIRRVENRPIRLLQDNVEGKLSQF